MSIAVQTRNLTKRYGSRTGVTAVDELNLTIPQGHIYSFLGPNGAGKTTTLRILLGLVKPSSGTASVLGEAPGTPSSLFRIGALIESPAFYPYLSGRDNLKVLALRSGKGAKGRVEEVLKQAGLAKSAKVKFKNYSIGMKQRLGVAAALLDDPELLILDEPTSGLDPQGAAEMRQFIGSLKGQKTVLFSSHVLDEVERIADRVGIIQNGNLVAEGTVEDLIGRAGLFVRAEPIKEAVQIAKRLKGVEQVDIMNGMLHLAIDPEEGSRINRKLVGAGLDVGELRPARRSLEDVYLELIRDSVGHEKETRGGE